MLSLLVNLALVAAAHSAAIGTPDHTLIEHERIDLLPSGWQPAGTARDGLLHLRIYLKHAHKNVIQIAEDVSNPASDLYGQHLSVDQLRQALPDFQRPSDSVLEWISAQGAKAYHVGPDWIDFAAQSERVNSMLDASFSSYRYHDGEPVLRTERYSIPRELQEHIDFIYPTVHFMKPSRGRELSASALERRQHFPTGPLNCTNSVCPSQLQTKYNINYVPEDDKSCSKIGIAGFLEQFPNITDVNSFLSQYGINKTAPAPNVNIVSVNNGTSQAPAEGGALTVEAELDVDYVTAFTGPLPASFISVGGRGVQLMQPGNTTVSPSENEPYLEFLQWLLAEENPPQVISISYSDDEQAVPELYARRVCDLFAQAAARGISIIGSSGDGGASGTSGDAICLGPSGERRFIPTFPSSCPWYTSVGATAGYGGGADYSSGGFSNFFARPSWQDEAVNSYITQLNGSHKGLYNASGRAIPDVSLLGSDFLTLTGGYAGQHDGTSASTPVFAAMITLINDIRLRSGKPVLGFLNPMLYAQNATSVYHDIADDSQSTGCSDGNFIEPGWQAAKGWDAITGLGEPDFEKLRALLG